MAQTITTGRKGSALGRGDLAASLLFIFPLFLAYEIGVMFSTTMNGADFVTRVVWDAVDRDRDTYLAIHLTLAAVFLGYVLYLRRQGGLRGGFLPMLLESAIYALTLGSFILFVMYNLLGFDPGLGAGALGEPWAWAFGEPEALALGEVGQKLVISLGAGVHEELVFRLGLMAGGAGVLKWLGVRNPVAVALALIASSALFSAAHHVGPLGGALGSVCRHLVGVGAHRVLGARLPYGTFAVNLVGSFALGLAMAVFADRGALDSRLRIAVTVGFLGGFTTYSSFAFETVGLLQHRRVAAAALYVGLTLIAAALACWAGIACARALR